MSTLRAVGRLSVGVYLQRFSESRTSSSAGRLFSVRALLALVLSLSPAVARAEVPFLAAQIGEGPAVAGAADARRGQTVRLHLVVPLPGGRYLTSAPRLLLHGRAVPDEALVRPDGGTAETARWSRIEPRMFHLDESGPEREPRAYTNSVLFGPQHGRWRGVDPIGYFETPVQGARGLALTVRDARPSDRRFDTHGGLGVMRFAARATALGRAVSTPGIETVHPSGVGDDVFRVTFRAGDDFRGWLTTFHNVPNVFGSAGRGTHHQTARYVGTDCADVLLGGLRRATGRPYEFTSVGGLSRLTRTIAEAHLGSDELTDDDGQEVRLRFGRDVRPGDLVLIDYGVAAIPRPWAHVGVLWDDRSPDGVLGPEDGLAHTAFLRGLAVQALGSQAPSRIRIVRWNSEVTRALERATTRPRS
jgi:hypothetical protein